MADAILKRCTLCGETKQGEMFSPCKRNKDGLYSWCKPCAAARTRAWAEKNKERVKEAVKARYWADPAAACAKSIAYYRAKTGGGPKKPAQLPVPDAEGRLTFFCSKCSTRKLIDHFYMRPSGAPYTVCKDCTGARNSAYVAENEARVKAYKKRWREENIERIRAERLEKYASSEAVRAEHAAKAREWKAKNPEKRAAIAQNYKHRRRAQEEGGITSRDLMAWKKAQKKVCHWCRKKCPDDYHIDHIQPLARGGQHVASNLCIACPTCNIRKSARDPIEFAQSLGLLL